MHVFLVYLVFADWLIGPGQKSGRLSNYTAKPSRRYFRPPATQATLHQDAYI